MTDPDTNQENDSLTPAQLFANYGGSNYRTDYRLRPGVWVLTAGSNGSYVGAFGLMDLPVVTIMANQAEAAEGTPGQTATFTLTRTGPTNEALTVFYRLAGTAMPGDSAGGDYLTDPPANYAERTGCVVIPVEHSTATVVVLPIDDATPEEAETIILVLTSNVCYAIGAQSNATATIQDNDLANIPPVANAGPDQNILTNSLPARVGLAGSAHDPDTGPSPLQCRWRKVSGPGDAVFGDDSKTNTAAEFTAAGVYVLELDAYDGADRTNDTVTIRIARNNEPVVDDGPDGTITLFMSVPLEGKILEDDGLPRPADFRWKKLSRPGTVVFGDETELETIASFSETGIYVLELETDDGMAKGTDETTVTVRPNLAFNAVKNGRFNAPETWNEPEGVKGPPIPGDTANIWSNVTVVVETSDEIQNATTVNVADGGELHCENRASPGSSISTGATLNVSAGGILVIASNHTLGCTVNLSGGTMALDHGTVGGTLNVNTDSQIFLAGDTGTISASMHGHGKLTLNGIGQPLARLQCDFEPDSDWLGGWDIRCNVLFVCTDCERTFSGDARV